MNEQLFDDVYDFPNDRHLARYQNLVGLDDVKEILDKEARILLNPTLLKDWSQRHHGTQLSVVDLFARRHPFFIFEGDVGIGKSALAETFGDHIAREERRAVKLYMLSLKTRGIGAVGQMTSLISSAFDQVATESVQRRDAGTASILLIDEADALAQSRDESQMHHEDRAAVDALIRGLDRILEADGHVLVVMCTNRIDSIDSAVRRRAARVFKFVRPNDEQRRFVLTEHLGAAGFNAEQLNSLVAATGPGETRDYGFSYSDLYAQLLPALVLDALPERPLSFERAREIVLKLQPTPPFGVSR